MTTQLSSQLASRPDHDSRSECPGCGAPGCPATDARAALVAPRSSDLTPLLTMPEVARLLRLDERTIRRLIAARRLPCLRLGRQLRFDPRALSRWLAAREEG